MTPAAQQPAVPHQQPAETAQEPTEPVQESAEAGDLGTATTTAPPVAVVNPMETAQTSASVSTRLFRLPSNVDPDDGLDALQ